MSSPFVGLVISAFFVATFSVLFAIENRRGVRYFPRTRDMLDTCVSVLENLFKKISLLLHRDFLYQTTRYLFNVLLAVLLRSVRFFEDRIQLAMRRNRLMAKRAGKARAARNKLDEIAEHKASTVLTAEERKKRLRESLLQ